MWKKCNVVVLATTNDNAPLLFLGNDKKLSLEFRRIPSSMFHLYITSNEVIEKDDYMYCHIDSKIMKWDGDISLSKNPTCYGYKKIITTTDVLCLYKSGIDVELFIPQIPTHFVDYFIEEYNKGNVITEVEVEFDECKECRGGRNHCIGSPDNYIGNVCDSYTLKINPDNTINIKPIKSDYSREEVIVLLNKLAYDIAGNGMVITSKLKAAEWWIDKNL